MLRIAVLGVGSRGLHYAQLSRQRGGVAFAAFCDKDPAKLENAVATLQAQQAQTFTDEADFFAAGKLADVLYICTQDRDHCRQALRALELGYHVLLEKPVSPNAADCAAIARKAEQVGRSVFVCHVLRYSAYYRRIKQVLDEQLLGDLMLIQHDEHVGYWHFAHSFVRGNWRREDETTPLLMAKCCHDMDLLYWWVGGKCETASSVGALSYFTPQNAPAGAALRCRDCPLADRCLYACLAQYQPTDGSAPRFPWGTFAITPSKDPAAIRQAILDGPYGRCVFYSDNDVCDHQTAQLVFRRGEQRIPVQFSVTAFSNQCYRSTHIYGTKGELWGDDHQLSLTLQQFGQPPRQLDWQLPASASAGSGHVGGDPGLIWDVLDRLEGKDVPLSRMTPIQETLESHLIVQACERSRRQGGACVPVHP